MFVLVFCDFLHCLDVGIGRKLLYAVLLVREIKVSSNWFECILVFFCFFAGKVFLLAL